MGSLNLQKNTQKFWCIWPTEQETYYPPSIQHPEAHSPPRQGFDQAFQIASD